MRIVQSCWLILLLSLKSTSTLQWLDILAISSSSTLSYSSVSPYDSSTSRIRSSTCKARSIICYSWRTIGVTYSGKKRDRPRCLQRRSATPGEMHCLLCSVAVCSLGWHPPHDRSDTHTRSHFPSKGVSEVQILLMHKHLHNFSDISFKETLRTWSS